MNGYKMTNTTSGITYLPASNVELPDEVDWRKQGYVTPVKNQVGFLAIYQLFSKSINQSKSPNQWINKINQIHLTNTK